MEDSNDQDSSTELSQREGRSKVFLVHSFLFV